VQRALAQSAGLDAKLVAQRMMGWTDGRATPNAARYMALRAPADARGAGGAGQPYPFFLAHALQRPLAEFDAPGAGAGLAGGVEVRRHPRADRQARRRGVDLVARRGTGDRALPGGGRRGAGLPDGSVLDGEMLAWRPGADTPATFNLLQQRIARKTLSKKLLADAPVVFVAYDLLEDGGVDLREQPQHQRRSALEALLPRAMRCACRPP
jgi:DNA ligase 1